jgi:hypothetical protein
MVNGDGMKIKGFQPDEKVNMTNQLSAIKLGSTTITATPTATVKMSMKTFALLAQAPSKSKLI